MSEFFPEQSTYADDDDKVDWDIERHGRMRDHAAPDDSVPTTEYVPEED